jgi:hypothetical protein
VLASWLASVGLSFLYYPSLPVLGASVIISFFMGFTAPWLYRRKRLAFWQMLILLVIGCLLPHIAGIYHLILFALASSTPRQKDSFANLKNSTFNIQHSTLKIKNASSKIFIKGTTSAADFRKEAQRISRGR